MTSEIYNYRCINDGAHCLIKLLRIKWRAKQVLSRRPWTQWTWTAGWFTQGPFMQLLFKHWSVWPMQLQRQDPCLKEQTIKRQNTWCSSCRARKGYSYQQQDDKWRIHSPLFKDNCLLCVCHTATFVKFKSKGYSLHCRKCSKSWLVRTSNLGSGSSQLF